MLNVEILDITYKPIDLISRAMGTCYGHDDVKESRVKRAFNDQHMSVFEHVKVTFKLSGISRACANQLVRHRMASYCQESQRYVKLDSSDEGEWYIIPKMVKESVDNDICEVFDVIMSTTQWAYTYLLEHGVSAEDARYVLPNAAETTIVVTMNLRELYHFFDLRCDSHAQWEIREMANKLKETISKYDQWDILMTLSTEH